MSNTKTVTLVEIAESMNKDPKAARAKFRRIYADGEKGLPKTIDNAWQFSTKDVPAVKKLLGEDHRRASE